MDGHRRGAGPARRKGKSRHHRRCGPAVGEYVEGDRADVGARCLRHQSGEMPAVLDRRCRPRATPDEAAACRPYLERELALTGAAMLVTLGQAAAKGLLGAAARGKVLRRGELPVVATYHPDDLLRRPEDKAKAWGDLCLARAARDGAA